MPGDGLRAAPFLACAVTPANALQVVTERLTGHDPDVGLDGRIYLTTHTYNRVLRRNPNRYRQDIAGRDQGIIEPTAVAFDPSDNTSPYCHYQRRNEYSLLAAD